MKSISLFAALAAASVFIVGCGDDNKGNLTPAQAAWVKQKYYQDLYGGGTSSTSTSTIVTVYTMTSTSTVTTTH
jgi:hypothetical protein